MERNHFNKLAGAGFAVPRFLVLVIVPSAPSDLALCDEESMKLHHGAYWCSLADQQPLEEDESARQSVTVRIPQVNLLTPHTLEALVAGPHEEGEQ